MPDVWSLACRATNRRKTTAKGTAWVTWEAGRSTVNNTTLKDFLVTNLLILRSQVFCVIAPYGLVISSRCFKE